jgi:hypothetical protein
VSWSWYLYTTRPPADVVAVDASYQAALEEYLDEHEVNDDFAEAGAGGKAPPTAEEVAELAARFRKQTARDVLERLAACRATVSFDYVRDDPEWSPMQVSSLRFWLERLAPCVMDWGGGELSFELGEHVLARLKKMRSCGALGGAAPVKRRTVRRRAEKPGEVRAIRILECFDQARADPGSALDLQRALGSLSEHAQRYVELLVQEGARPDTATARALGLSVMDFRSAVEEVERAIASLRA